MDPEMRRFLSSINGNSVRLDLKKMVEIYDGGISRRLAWQKLVGFINNPPHGFMFTESEGYRFAVDIRRVKDAHQ